MDRLKIFETELGYIRNAKIREFVEKTLLKLPDYFFTMPASTSGRFHPKFSLGEGGLIRHTQVAVRIAFDIIGLPMMKYSDIDKDIVIASLILHDGTKAGMNGGGTVVIHPMIMGDFIEENEDLNSILDKDTLTKIVDAIRSHMGCWAFDYKDKYKKNQLMPFPNSKIQNMVHLADYIASRKYFEEFNFDIQIQRDK